MRKLAGMTFERWVGVFLIVLSVLTVSYSVVQTSRLGDVTECQAQYNEAYTAALKDRTKAAAKERRAQRDLLTTLLSGRPLTPDQARAEFNKYLGVLNDADHQRDSAPIPTNRC